MYMLFFIFFPWILTSLFKRKTLKDIFKRNKFSRQNNVDRAVSRIFQIQYNMKI